MGAEDCSYPKPGSPYSDTPTRAVVERYLAAKAVTRPEPLSCPKMCVLLICRKSRMPFRSPAAVSAV